MKERTTRMYAVFGVQYYILGMKGNNNIRLWHLFNAWSKIYDHHKILVNITLNDIAILLIQFVTIFSLASSACHCFLLFAGTVSCFCIFSVQYFRQSKKLLCAEPEKAIALFLLRLTDIVVVMCAGRGVWALTEARTQTTLNAVVALAQVNDVEWSVTNILHCAVDGDFDGIRFRTIPLLLALAATGTKLKYARKDIFAPEGRSGDAIKNNLTFILFIYVRPFLFLIQI